MGVKIPSSVNYIGAWAFSGCTGLTSVRFQGNAPSIGNGVFENTNLGVLLIRQQAKGFASSAWQGLPLVIALQNDFDGDGLADLLVANSKTHATVALYNSGTLANGPTLSSSLSICGFADLNGDMDSDWVLFNSKTRRLTGWLMQGVARTGTVSGTVAVPAGNDVVALEDMNGDGSPDAILFNKTTRRVTYWLMSGLGYAPVGVK
jgi:hypothetical protein